MTELEIFTEALNLADAATRGVFLDEACRGDDDLRRRLDELLSLNEAGEALLDRGIPSLVESLESGRITSGVFSEESLETATQQVLGLLEPSSEPGVMGRLGHYDVRQVLGFGGYGIVVKAFDTKLSRVVAIKLMSPSLALTSPPRRRFLREARSEAAVKHENVVQIYAVEESPIPYLVMEFVAGETLQQRFDRLGPFEASEVIRIGQQIALGLVAAHEQGLIHRDIKPANILLEDGVYPTAKLTDFGLARTADDASMSQSGTVAGTPMYMSPEQVRGEVLDQRADLFSFGSVLYAMCTGRPPFRAPTTLAVLKRVAEDTPRPIRDLIPETPEGLCAVISRLLEKSRDDRFSSAKEAAAALATCLTDSPITLRRRRIDSRGSWWQGRARSVSLRVGLLLVLGLLATEVTGLTRFFGASRRPTESTTARNGVGTQATDERVAGGEAGNSVEPVIDPVAKPTSSTGSAANLRLPNFFEEEAKLWRMRIGTEQAQVAELIPEPVLRWQSAAGPVGELFVWVDEGRPVAVGGASLTPSGGRFVVSHELHALGPEQLNPVFRDSIAIWQPRAGVTLYPLPGSPKVAAEASQRTAQFLAIAGEFTARVNNFGDSNHRTLRLFPEPLFRYAAPREGVIDGALLAFVFAEDSEPEILLMLEARQEAGHMAWFYRPLRMSEKSLELDRRGERIWNSPAGDLFGDYFRDRTYCNFADREIDKLPNTTMSQELSRLMSLFQKKPPLSKEALAAKEAEEKKNWEMFATVLREGVLRLQKPADLLTLYQVEAKRWEMWLDTDKQWQAAMVLKPVYLWQNASGDVRQRGSVFVWVYGGQPVAVGGVLLNPDGERFGVVHEIHALSPQQLFPVFRDSETKWEPLAGVSRFPLPNGLNVADTADERTEQLESIARDFTAQAIDNGVPSDLPRHPQLLHRYDESAGEVLDGALFAFVRESQGDPEMIVAVEARRVNDAVSWHYRAIRLAVAPLTLDYQRERVWDSILNDPNSEFNNAANTLFLHSDHVIDALPPDKAP